VSFVTGGPPVADRSPRTAVVRGCWGIVGGCVDVEGSEASACSEVCLGGIVGVSGAEKADAVGSRGVCTLADALLPGILVSVFEVSVATCRDRESVLACAGA